MCANADANASSSMSHAVARVRDGMLSSHVQVSTRAPGQRHVYCSGEDTQTKDGVSIGGELEMDDRVRER